MDPIRKVVSLPPSERWLLVKTAALLGAVRLSLLLLPFSSTRRLLRWASRRSYWVAANPAPVERVAWAVDVASRLVPGAAHCLTQALAAQILLVRRGYPAEVRFGVLREPKNTNVMAHAWVESNGVVVLGGTDVKQRYVRLTSPLDPTA